MEEKEITKDNLLTSGKNPIDLPPFQLLMHIEDVDKALAFYNLAGASIDPDTLKHVAQVCWCSTETTFFKFWPIK